MDGAGYMAGFELLRDRTSRITGASPDLIRASNTSGLMTVMACLTRDACGSSVRLQPDSTNCGT